MKWFLAHQDDLGASPRAGRELGSKEVLGMITVALFCGSVGAQCSSPCTRDPGCDHQSNASAGFCASSVYMLMSKQQRRSRRIYYTASVSFTCFGPWYPSLFTCYQLLTRSAWSYYSTYHQRQTCVVSCCSGYIETAPNTCQPISTALSTDKLEFDFCSSSVCNDGICNHFPGGYNCTCYEGFQLTSNNTHCQDVDECDSNSTNPCSQNCTNTNGSFYCQCTEGYQLDSDNTTCIDIDECRLSSTLCNGTCNIFPAGNNCRSYYEGFQLWSNNTQDIDGCRLSYTLCNATCNNFLGGYNCTCYEGFQLTSNNTHCQGLPSQSGSLDSASQAVLIAIASLVLVAGGVATSLAIFWARVVYKRRKLRGAIARDEICGGIKAKGSTEIDEWELSYSDFEIQGILGTGEFGEVFLAFLKNNNCTSKVRSYFIKLRAQGDSVSTANAVAIKFLKADGPIEHQEMFLKEIAMMKRVSSPGCANVVQLIGSVVASEPLVMVMEYSPLRDLHSNLREWSKQNANGNIEGSRGTKDCDDFPLEQKDILSFAFQISSGMVYLASLHIVHRDLACRNILVGYAQTLKIADFGLSKEVDGHYSSKSHARLPIRWMAPEAVVFRVFSEKSDLWSFAVCLWEICTLGEVPFGYISNKDIAKAIASGEVLDHPAQCPSEMYDLMSICWRRNPKDRPTFHEANSVLKEIIASRVPNAGYIDVIPSEDINLDLEDKPIVDTCASNSEPFVTTTSL